MDLVEALSAKPWGLLVYFQPFLHAIYVRSYSIPEFLLHTVQLYPQGKLMVYIKN